MLSIVEKEILEKLNTYDVVIGIDEVGRGPIAGPVTVCAFAISKQYYEQVFEGLAGITDSKKIVEKKRIKYTETIRTLKKQGFLDVAISSVSASIIDRNGIFPAICSSLEKSLKKVTEYKNAYIYLDGSLYAPKHFDQETIIKGDSKNWLIGAASIVAKVSRDNQMVQYSKKFPEYNFEKHKGYGTKGHYEKIKKYGLCEIHRKTWVKS